MQLPNFKRDITSELAKRLTGKNHFIQVLSGPRQVGKTTAVKQVLNELQMRYHYSSADLPYPPEASWIISEWERARTLDTKAAPAILVLDEVQKIPRWSEVVKRLWDEDRSEGRNLHVVVLGSSSLLIQKGLTESLAGRFEQLHCLHWEFKECRQCFNWDIDQYLFFGGYPGAAVLIEDETRWKSYVLDSLIESAISKDVLMLNPVEKPALLRKLFVLACEFAAQILSYQKMLGQLTDAGNTTTLAHYQKLLESAYLIAGLEKFSGSKIRRRSSSPKWLPLNAALVTALDPKSFLETRSNPALWGRLVECTAGIHLFNQAKKHRLELFYWREGNLEVDYVLQKGRELIAIEVKSGRKRNVTSGLSQFEKRYKPLRSFIIGPGGMPLEEFLTSEATSLFT